MNRLGWDEYFLNMLTAIGARSTCDRGRCGAIIVRDHTILSTGYAGSPKGFPHCDDVGHEFEYYINEGDAEWIGGEKIVTFKLESLRKSCIRTIHAEQNAIYHAAETGVSLEGGTIYSTMFPCFRCAMAIVQVGIVRVVALHEYHGSVEAQNTIRYAGLTYGIVNPAKLYT